MLENDYISSTRDTIRCSFSFTLGGNAIAHSEDVTADTGTSWINVPNRVVDRIVSATNADYDFQNDMYLVNCDAKALPTWVFRFGGRDYPLTSADYLLPVSGNGFCQPHG